MKKFYLLLSFLVIGFSAKAVTEKAGNFDRPNYRDAFIFVERGVEFAVFPDGQFDFFFNPRGNFNRIPSNINYSFNSGYNYGPFVQYDDYGAVIQIENVPVYYDYYGRIIRAGRVNIGYNAFGMVNRVGNMFLHYNHYNQFTHTSGFINNRNARYIYRPWHQHYMRPNTYVIVYNEPYRLYYTPNRMKYTHYKRYYNNHYSNNNFQKSYYRPGEKVTTYHRGRRDSTPREVRTAVVPTRGAAGNTSQRNIRQTERREIPANQRVETRTGTSRVESQVIEQNRAPQTRTSRAQNVPAPRNTEVQQRTERTASPATERNVVNQRRSTTVNTTPARETPAQTRRTETPAEVKTAPQVRTSEPASTGRTRGSRGGQ